MKSKMAREKLIKIAKDQNNIEKIRIYALLALMEIGDFKFIENFLPLKNIKEKDILEILIIAITKLHAIDFIDEFLDFINYSDKEIKLKIIDSLSGFNEIKALRILLKFYNNEEDEIKNLIKMNVKKSKVLKKYIEELDEMEALNILTIIPKEKAEKLINKLIRTTEDKNILKVLIKGIGELELKNGTELLEKLYNEIEDENLKLKIIEALGNNKGKKKKDLLLSLLKSKKTNRNIKTKILFGIKGFMNEEDVFSEIKEIIENQEEWWMLRKVAILTIGEARNSKALSTLVKVLKKEKDDRVIRTLIQEIGEIGNEKNILDLEKYLEDNNADLKKIAVLALSKLGSKKVLDILLENKNIREELMPESLEAIINFDDIRVLDILLKVLKTGEEKKVEKILKGLALFKNEKIKKGLIEFINDKGNKREQRSKGLMILANYKDEEVDFVLKNILEDDFEWWMLKKIAIMIIGEQKNYNLISYIADQTNNLDERISLSAKLISKVFFKEYLLEKIKLDTKLYDFAENYLKIL
ncbi:MAG: hypothetical protein B6I28_05705 [Fusobacteriia bacterium 4572_132]|nr:MAG: hypothetical protein B6I28_05705 [Fusobacteriia bacterium 4572_132]